MFGQGGLVSRYLWYRVGLRRMALLKGLCGGDQDGLGLGQECWCSRGTASGRIRLQRDWVWLEL